MTKRKPRLSDYLYQRNISKISSQQLLVNGEEHADLHLRDSRRLYF